MSNRTIPPGIAKLLDHADRIEALPPDRFDMGDPGEYTDAETGECGSPACIGGWVRAWQRDGEDIAEVGARAWHFPVKIVERLMFPGVRRLKSGKLAYSATPPQAAAAMRNLARTALKRGPEHADPEWETVE